MYSKAVVRRPGSNFVKGITTSNLGNPDFAKTLEQHAAYCNALKRCGLEVTVLEADERYADGCFVEDTAIINREVAVITRPGALYPADPQRISKIKKEDCGSRIRRS